MGYRLAITGTTEHCGKTSVAVNLAAALVQMNRSILLVDLDPDRDATALIRAGPEIDADDLASGESGDLLELVSPTLIPKVEILPATLRLSEYPLSKQGKLWHLAVSLASAFDRWDYVLIDCPSATGPLMSTGIDVSDYIILILEATDVAVNALDKQLKFIQDEATRRQEPLDILGLLVTNADTVREGEAVQHHLRKSFGDAVFRTLIRRSEMEVNRFTDRKAISSSTSENLASESFQTLAAEIVLSLEYRRATFRSN